MGAASNEALCELPPTPTGLRGTRKSKVLSTYLGRQLSEVSVRLEVTYKHPRMRRPLAGGRRVAYTNNSLSHRPIVVKASR